QNGAGRRWHYSGLSACLPRPVRSLGASRNRDRSPGRSIWMRTDDLPLLRQALLTIPLVLSAACGSTAGSPPEVAQPPPDAGPTVPAVDPGPSLARTEGWSVRRRMRLPAGTDVVLEEQLASFTVAAPGASRIRRVDSSGSSPWNAPASLFIEDAALHPSGAVTAVLVDADF